MNVYYAQEFIVTDNYDNVDFLEPFTTKYYNVDELVEAGQGSCSCLAEVELELLILEGILPEDYYENKCDDTYLSEEEVSKLIKIHNIQIYVQV